MENLDNSIHCCDNLELLGKMPNNYINLIYCDIFTDGFKDSSLDSLFNSGLKVKEHSDYFSEKHPKILERV